jgi:ABC-type glycerol-3-phosphate transport system substrate-binding protein
MNKRWTLAMAAVVAMLSACGGGNGADTASPPVTAEVPASVSQSVTGMMSYLLALVAVHDEALEPVDVSAVTPPTNDTAEPMAID